MTSSTRLNGRSVMPGIFYRIVRGNPPTLDDFISNAAKGRPLRDSDPEARRLWDGISVQATEAQARRRVRQCPALGRYMIGSSSLRTRRCRLSVRRAFLATTRSGATRLSCSVTWSRWCGYDLRSKYTGVNHGSYAQNRQERHQQPRAARTARHLCLVGPRYWELSRRLRYGRGRLSCRAPLSRGTRTRVGGHARPRSRDPRSHSERGARRGARRARLKRAHRYPPNIGGGNHAQRRCRLACWATQGLRQRRFGYALSGGQRFEEVDHCLDVGFAG